MAHWNYVKPEWAQRLIRWSGSAEKKAWENHIYRANRGNPTAEQRGKECSEQEELEECFSFKKKLPMLCSVLYLLSGEAACFCVWCSVLCVLSGEAACFCVLCSVLYLLSGEAACFCVCTVQCVCSDWCVFL